MRGMQVKRLSVVAGIMTLLTFAVAFAQDGKAPAFAPNVPAQIETPDSVKTRIGTLKFHDGAGPEHRQRGLRPARLQPRY